MTKERLLERLQEKTTVDWSRYDVKGNAMFYNDIRIIVEDDIITIYAGDWWNKVTTNVTLEIPLSTITEIIWHDMIYAMSIETMYSYSYFIQF